MIGYVLTTAYQRINVIMFVETKPLCRCGIIAAELHRVDADDLPVAVDQRAAGVAVVERGIRLDQRHRPVVDLKVAVDRGDDAARHRAAQLRAERIADGDDAVAHGQFARIAELRGLQVRRVHLQHGKVARLVAADD